MITTDTTTDAIYEKLSRLLSDTVPDFELRLKAELAAEINRLKVEKNAVILGHNYMEPALFHSILSATRSSSVAKRRRLTKTSSCFVA
jgi:quinolinate synthase